MPNYGAGVATGLIIASASNNSNASSDTFLAVNQCNAMETKKETRECLVQIQKQIEYDDFVAGTVMGTIVLGVILFIIFLAWVNR
jgi:hypothetical protein